MADTDKSDLVARFQAVTGADEDRSKFFLESSAWKLDIALASFYEGDNDNFGEGIVEPQAQPAVPQPDREASDWLPRPQQTSRFATISSLHDDNQGDSSEEEGQAFYAGGSERSGQQIIGPPKKKNTDELVKNMFKSAKEHGAEEVQAGSSDGMGRRAGPSFGGTGYRLGETEDSSDVIKGAAANTRPKSINVVLKLWKDGFSVDDGQLRRYNEPDNKEFLDSIHRGEVPDELLQYAKGGEVNLNMEDHRTEEFVAPRVQVHAFGGQGHMLGSPAPSVPSAAKSTKPSSTAAAPAGVEIKVDGTKPTTNLQIRLSDGSRLVAKFNHTHTVADVRNYINSSRPHLAASTYVLMTTFPNKELAEESQSLADANLLNAVLVQRLK